MNELTPDQKLRVCRLIWPERQVATDETGSPCFVGLGGIPIPIDLTSKEALGAMVARLEQYCRETWQELRRFPDGTWSVGPMKDYYTPTYESPSLERLVLEVAGDE